MRSITTHKNPFHWEQESDELLLQRLQDGEQGALNTLMQRHYEPLTRFVYHYINGGPGVEDIVQESFIRLYFKAKGFRFQSAPRTWLYQIAINLCKDHHRRNKQSMIPWDIRIHDSEVHEPSIDSQIQHRRDLIQLSKYIALLPKKLKAALILFAIEEKSQEECAALLGITPKALEMRVYRARKLLTSRFQVNI